MELIPVARFGEYAQLSRNINRSDGFCMARLR